MATSKGIEGGNSGSGTTVAVTLATITANSTIAVGVLWQGVTDTVSVADGQGSYTSVQAAILNTNESLQCFFLKAANSGSHTITATFSGSNSETYIYAIEIKGAHLTAPLGTTAQGSATTGTALATAATLSGSSGDMIVAFGGNETDAETYTKGATFDSIAQVAQIFGETRALSGSVSSFAADATQSATGHWTIQGLTIVAAPGSSSNSKLVKTWLE